METMEGAKAKSDYGNTGAVSSGSMSASGSDISHAATKDFADRSAEAYAQTKATVAEAYGKTTEMLNDTYEWTMTYGRDNPGRTMLIAFGAGAGVGLLLAASGRKRSRSSYYGEPVVNAVSQIASELFRRR
jgi:hypothetical protein